MLFAQNLNEIKLGIVYSEQTKNLVYSEDKYFYPIQDWEIFFLNNKLSYTVINDEQLDDNDFDFLDVLILPSVEVLSESAEVNLKMFLDSGKGLLIFGKIGEYDTNGKRKYENFLQRNANFIYTELYTQQKISERHSISSSVLSRKLNVGTDLLILNNYNPLAVFSTSGNVNHTGEYILHDDKISSKEYSGIVQSDENPGRIIWFGFQLSQILGDKAQEKTVKQLIFNSVEWLSPLPVLLLKQWPENFTIPVVISAIVKDSKTISSDLVEEFLAKQLKVNFFFNSEEIALMDNLMSKCVAAGDVNLLLNSNTSNIKIDDSNLKESYEFLGGKSRQKYCGIRLSDAQFTTNQERIFNSSFNFITSDDNFLNIIKENEGRKFPAVSFSIENDDYDEILEKFDLIFEDASRNEKLLEINLFEKSLRGQQLTLNISFWAIINLLHKQNAWITTYSEFIDWIIQKDNINIITTKPGEQNKFEVTVENRNQYDVKNLELELFIPALKYNPKISNSKIDLMYNSTSSSYILTIPFIRAGVKEVFLLEFGDDI